MKEFERENFLWKLWIPRNIVWKFEGESQFFGFKSSFSLPCSREMGWVQDRDFQVCETQSVGSLVVRLFQLWVAGSWPNRMVEHMT
jgi:hypothetical protein